MATNIGACSDLEKFLKLEGTNNLLKAAKRWNIGKSVLFPS